MVSVLDNVGNIGTCEISFQVELNLEESEAMESFGNDQIDGFYPVGPWQILLPMMIKAEIRESANYTP